MPTDDIERFERRMRFRTRILDRAATHGYSLTERLLNNRELVWSWVSDRDGRLPAVFATKLEAMRYMRDLLKGSSNSLA